MKKMYNKEKFLQLVTDTDTTLISEINERIRNREMKLKRYYILPFVSFNIMEDAYKKIWLLDFGTRTKSIFHIRIKTFNTNEK
jgi:hypothetical protein